MGVTLENTSGTVEASSKQRRKSQNLFRKCVITQKIELCMAEESEGERPHQRDLRSKADTSLVDCRVKNNPWKKIQPPEKFSSVNLEKKKSSPLDLGREKNSFPDWERSLRRFIWIFLVRVIKFERLQCKKKYPSNLSTWAIWSAFLWPSWFCKVTKVLKIFTFRVISRGYCGICKMLGKLLSRAGKFFNSLWPIGDNASPHHSFQSVGKVQNISRAICESNKARYGRADRRNVDLEFRSRNENEKKDSEMNQGTASIRTVPKCLTISTNGTQFCGTHCHLDI